MGYWIMVSASAVLIGEEYGKISARGKRRMAGTVVSMIVLSSLVFFNANTIALVVLLVLTMIGMGYFMPDKYIMGSACIGMNAAVCGVLVGGTLSYAIVFQLVFWTVVGSLLTLVVCYVLDKLIPSLYEDYTKEKLIVARKQL